MEVDFHFYNLAFAREQGFSPEKTSTFMSVVTEVLAADRRDGLRPMSKSFEAFKLMLHAHAVERPPTSAGIFGVDDVKSIVDYFTNSYYRHFRLYQYVLAKKPQLKLAQRTQCNVEEPSMAAPLAKALPVSVTVYKTRRGSDASSDGGE